MLRALSRAGLTTGLVIATSASCGSSERMGFADPAPGDAGSVVDAGSSGAFDPPAPPKGDAAAPFGCDAIDVVFVFDASTSMQEEKKNLLENLPAFVDVLDGFAARGKPVDYRLGVIDTTLTHVEATMFTTVTKTGSDGKLLRQKECGLADPWVERSDPDRTRHFTCLGDLPLDDSSSAFEMPLGALGSAVSADQAEFLRKDALLGVVIVSDEDDKTSARIPLDTADDGCPASAPWARPVSDVIATLDTAKGGRRDAWAVAVVAGPGPGDCTSSFGSACEARRLRELSTAAGSRGTFGSVCAGDLSPALTEALDVFRRACAAMPPPDVR